MIGQTLRFDPRYAAAQQAIAQGQIGDLVHIYARRNNGITSALAQADKTSVLFFLGVHDIYFVNWCAASRVETVFGSSHQKVLGDFDTPDTTLALLKYENGMIASLEFSWVLPASVPSRIEARFEAVGTEGLINLDGGNRAVEVIAATGIDAPDTWYTPEVDGLTVGILRDEISHFVDCVRDDREPAVSGEDGREAVRVVCAVAESLASGHPVTL
jgi:predicted dehydrogenase